MFPVSRGSVSLDSGREQGVTAGHLLVTGGAGYVGSHGCVELLVRGYELIILDKGFSPA